MNHDKLIPAVPAALLFAGAFSAFSSATTQLPSLTGFARALDCHQNGRIAQVGPRASEQDEVVVDEAFQPTNTVGSPATCGYPESVGEAFQPTNTVGSPATCGLPECGADDGPIYTAC